MKTNKWPKYEKILKVWKKWKRIKIKERKMKKKMRKKIEKKENIRKTHDWKQNNRKNSKNLTKIKFEMFYFFVARNLFKSLSKHEVLIEKSKRAMIDYGCFFGDFFKLKF